MEETIPDLGTAPPHPPAVADDGDHLPLVGVDHLLDLVPKVLEDLPVGAQRLLRGVESHNDSDVGPGIREVRLIVRVIKLPNSLGMGNLLGVDPPYRLDVLVQGPRSISPESISDRGARPDAAWGA